MIFSFLTYDLITNQGFFFISFRNCFSEYLLQIKQTKFSNGGFLLLSLGFPLFLQLFPEIFLRLSGWFRRRLLRLLLLFFHFIKGDRYLKQITVQIDPESSMLQVRQVFRNGKSQSASLRASAHIAADKAFRQFIRIDVQRIF